MPNLSNINVTFLLESLKHFEVNNYVFIQAVHSSLLLNITELLRKMFKKGFDINKNDNKINLVNIKLKQINKNLNSPLKCTLIFI